MWPSPPTLTSSDPYWVWTVGLLAYLLPKLDGNPLQISNLHPENRDQTEWSGRHTGAPVESKKRGLKFTKLWVVWRRTRAKYTVRWNKVHRTTLAQKSKNNVLYLVQRSNQSSVLGVEIKTKCCSWCRDQNKVLYLVQRSKQSSVLGVEIKPKCCTWYRDQNKVLYLLHITKADARKTTVTSCACPT